MKIRFLDFSFSNYRSMYKSNHKLRLFTMSELSIQSNFNGSNTSVTMKISSRQGLFELMSVNPCARSGGIIGIYFRFSLT